MFYCHLENKELTQDEVYFDYEENAFRCNKDNTLVEYIFK